MKNIMDVLNGVIKREAWEAFYRTKNKNPWNAREIMWKAIRLCATRASMPSWGLPFEAIAASALLKDRNKKADRKHKDLERLPSASFFGDVESEQDIPKDHNEIG